MSFAVQVYRNRTADFQVTILDADGAAIELSGGDQVRLRIGLGNAAPPLLEVGSDAPTAAGSSLTATNPALVRLAEGDLAALAPGAYDAEVSVLSAGPPAACRQAAGGVLQVLGTLGGN